MGTTTSPEVLIAWQSLHGLGFGAFWLGGVAFLSDIAPPEAPNAAQSLLPASTFGAGYILSISIAATSFNWIRPGVLFQIIGAGSSVTIGLTLLFMYALARRLRA
jgi:MFS family permease